MTACTHIREGDYIALDSGTTAFELASLICERFQKLTVLTNSLEAFRILSENSGIQTVLAGGFYLPEEKCFYGHLTLDMIHQLRVSKSFVTPSAVSLDFGISDYVPELIAVQRAFLGISDQPYVLVDSSKFETCAPLKICDSDSRILYLTDSELSDEIMEAYQKASINIIK